MGNQLTNDLMADQTTKQNIEPTVRSRPGWADLGLSFRPQPTSTVNHFGGGGEVFVFDRAKSRRAE